MLAIMAYTPKSQQGKDFALWRGGVFNQAGQRSSLPRELTNQRWKQIDEVVDHPTTQVEEATDPP
jgi:hypothetical protein